MLELFVIQLTSIWPSSIKIQINKHEGNFHYGTMPMMAPHILKTVDLTKAQKYRYLENNFFKKQH